MTQKSLILCHKLQGIDNVLPVRKAIQHDGVFLYITSDDTICFFDSIQRINITFPPPDSSIKGLPNYISMNPSHRYAAVGFSDGGIQLYDLQTFKAIKLIRKPKSPISDIVFLDDSFLLVGTSDGNLISYKISSRLLILSISETPLASFEQAITAIYVPYNYRFIRGSGKVLNSSICIASEFSSFFAISTTSQLLLSHITSDSKFESCSSINITSSQTHFFFENSKALNLVTCTNKVISIYLIKKDLTFTTLHSIELQYEPVFISAISPTIILAFSGTKEGNPNRPIEIIQHKNNTSNFTSMDVNGFFFNGNSSVYVLNKDGLLSLTLNSFEDQLLSIQTEGTFQDVMALCKAALSGDPVASIGLPSNVSQKADHIEHAISDILNSYITEELNKDSSIENGEKLTQFVINISSEMNMENWIIESGASLFSSFNLLLPFYSTLLKNDKIAKQFNYTSIFIEDFMNFCRSNSSSINFDVSLFLSSLSDRIISHDKLIEFGMETNNTLLISSIFFIDSQVIKALNILQNSSRWDLVAKNVYQYCNDPIFPDIIKWLFAVKKEDGKISFPRAQKIAHVPSSDKTFANVVTFVHSREKPFSFSDLLNALIIIQGNEQLSIDDPLSKYIDDLILSNQVIYNGVALSFVLKRLFSKEYQNKDHIEVILLSVIYHQPKSILESLIPLCKKFDLQSVKMRILNETKDYSTLFKENLDDSSQDTFLYVEKLARNNNCSKEVIQSSIKDNTAAFVLKDVNKFAHLIFTYFNDFSYILELMLTLTDTTIQNVFIRSIISEFKNSETNISTFPFSEALQLQYLNFLVKHYPNEVLDFIKIFHSNENIVLKMCEDYKLYDACSYLTYILKDQNKLSYFLPLYMKYSLMNYSNHLVLGKQCDELLNEIIDFSNDILNKILQKKKQNGKIVLSEMACSLIKSFVLPIYQIFQKQLECPLLSEFLCQICSICSKVIPFDEILKILIINFSDINVKYTRNAFIRIVNDFSYDIDIQKSKASLFHDDEKSEVFKSIQIMKSGIECDGLFCSLCHKRLNNDRCSATMFPCSHILHDDCAGMGKQCPVCFPIVGDKFGSQGEQNKIIDENVFDSFAVERLNKKMRIFERNSRRTVTFEGISPEYQIKQKANITLSSSNIHI